MQPLFFISLQMWSWSWSCLSSPMITVNPVLFCTIMFWFGSYHLSILSHTYTVSRNNQSTYQQLLHSTRKCYITDVFVPARTTCPCIRNPQLEWVFSSVSWSNRVFTSLHICHLRRLICLPLCRPRWQQKAPKCNENWIDMLDLIHGFGTRCLVVFHWLGCVVWSEHEWPLRLV